MIMRHVLFVWVLSFCIGVTACDSPQPNTSESAAGDDQAYEAPESAPPPAPSTDRSVGPILASAYDYLYTAGTEEPAYGLYSYALFPTYSQRAEAFITELFRTTGAAGQSGISRANLNVVYLPVQQGKRSLLSHRAAVGEPLHPSEFTRELYDYALARRVLAQICAAPSDALGYLCRSDLSRGPYLFTFSRPASELSPVPPPYLFVDLSRIHPRAFSEFISAYKEQVKRTDYSDRERIDHLRLHVLNIILTAADWVGPVRGAVADTVYLSTAAE